MAAARKNSNPKEVALYKVPKEAFTTTQLDLFQTFLVNTTDQRDSLSNAIDLWDSIPRYSISRAKQEELRSADGMLPMRTINFQHRGRAYVAQVRPARLEVLDADGNATGKSIEYYPSAREELIEFALRKLAAEQNAGFFDAPNYRSGVVFTLHQLRNELIARGHSITYADLVEGLEVMNLSNLRLTGTDSNTKEAGMLSQAYLPALVKVNRNERLNSPEAKWLVQFHGTLTLGVDRINYRQFNYQRLMRCRSQLSRWLITQLVLKFTQASIGGDKFRMKFSSVQRDSGLLNYKLTRQAVAALDSAFKEITKEEVLQEYEKEVENGPRNAIVDVTYSLVPSVKFVSEQRAANRRLLNANPSPPLSR